MTTWTTRIGDEAYDTTTGETWEQARDRLLGIAREAVDVNEGGCGHCLAEARQMVDQLTALSPGTAWRGDLELTELHLEQDA